MKSTFSRQVSTTVLILLLALLLLGGAFRILVGQYLEHNTHNQLQTDALALAELVAAYDAANDLQHENLRTNLTLASLVSGADTVVMDSLGNVILCSEPGLQCPHLGLTINQNFVDQVFENGSSFDTGTIPELYAEIRYYVSVPIVSHRTGSNIGLVTVSMPTGDTQALMEGIADIQVTVSLLVILIAVVIMSVSTRNECRPLREMAQAARDFGHGNLKARVRTGGHNSEEVDELAVAFNNMAESLEKSEYQRQEFVANVSHELKTPMTTIGGYIDGMLDGTIPPERHRYYMQIVSDETKRLSRLVRSMLDISRLQDRGGIPEEKKIRFDMEECIGEVLITFEQKIVAKNLEVNVDLPEHPVFTRAEKDAVTQVVYNLLDNAVKFCTEGGELGLKLRIGGNKIYVTISIEGQTIPPEELPLVFDRFHKIDKARNRSQEGWGLGLYIVKTLVCSHGENISVASREGKTEFTFTMPLVN
ncbi:MAG: HAMP domain-containing histidine kinase [Oscillospiraceae bacterium]|nr:HAMP domain-containing histidine kinase [Oscillospiraceae bacterium]